MNADGCAYCDAGPDQACDPYCPTREPICEWCGERGHVAGDCLSDPLAGCEATVDARGYPRRRGDREASRDRHPSRPR